MEIAWKRDRGRQRGRGGSGETGGDGGASREGGGSRETGGDGGASKETRERCGRQAAVTCDT